MEKSSDQGMELQKVDSIGAYIRNQDVRKERRTWIGILKRWFRRPVIRRPVPVKQTTLERRKVWQVFRAFREHNLVFFSRSWCFGTRRNKLRSSDETHFPRCSVCFDSKPEMETKKNRVLATKCGHIYCSECFDLVRIKQKKCAVCQKKITPKAFIELFC